MIRKDLSDDDLFASSLRHASVIRSMPQSAIFKRKRRSLSAKQVVPRSWRLRHRTPTPMLALMESKRREAQAARRQAKAVRKEDAALEVTRPLEVLSRQTNAESSDTARARSHVAGVVLEPALDFRVEYRKQTGD